MSKVFLIADLHFNDEPVFNSTCRCRDFEDIDEHNRAIIRNWNSVVSEDDTVFVLGDVGKDSDTHYIFDYIESLSGHKHLILGNHDKDISMDSRFWLDAGFESVHLYPIIYDDFYMLSHEPLFVNENQPKANIFGHVHDCCSYKTVSSRSFCVCAERINYTPIDFESVKNLIKEEANKSIKR